MTRTLNFSSGPSTLPEVVLRKAQAALLDLDGTGIGILEHSHRGAAFGAVLDRTEAVIREVGGLDDAWAVLFVTGGASTQFTQVPASFLGPGQVADYCHTGVWAGKAIEEAQRIGEVHVACSGEADGFAEIPDAPRWSTAARYAHYTSNNTVYGTQWAAPPAGSPAPLVCDASSDAFSRPLVLGGHALIYAGAQKNLGPSGVTLVLARRDFLATGRADLPPLQQYRVLDRERSMPNTPNTFGIFVLGEVVAWIRDQGGLPAMAEHNARKAARLYDFLDHSAAWRPHARPGSRSLMNVTFRGRTPALEEAFLARAEAEGLSGLRGHRSAGGLRASIYNAFPAAGVERLVELLHRVEREEG